MFLELYSASVLTIMFVTAVVVWVRDERRRQCERRARVVHSVRVRPVDELTATDLARKRERRRAAYVSSMAVRR